jgi:hypothetical protein
MRPLACRRPAILPGAASCPTCRFRPCRLTPSGLAFAHDPAVLQLTVDARLALPGPLGLRTTADLAALVAAVGGLGALSCGAVRDDVPLSGLVRRAASTPWPSAYQGVEVTVWWAAREVWGLVLPDAAAKTATETMVGQTISPLGVRDDDVPVVKSVSYGSPLELVLHRHGTGSPRAEAGWCF